MIRKPRDSEGRKKLSASDARKQLDRKCAEQGNCCHYCNAPLTREPGQPNTAVREHAKPQPAGCSKDDSDDNIVAACWACNGEKGSKRGWKKSDSAGERSVDQFLGDPNKEIVKDGEGLESGETPFVEPTHASFPEGLSALEGAISRGRSFYDPPPDITVSEWARLNRILPKGTTRRPGAFIPEKFQVEPMDAVLDPAVHEIVFLK